MIILVDFGSQTTHLISRRIRELGQEVLIVAPEEAMEKVKNAKGIILSGGPAGVYEKKSPIIDKKIFELGIPILGICYGQQLVCHLLGGEVIPGAKKEYGPAELRLQVTGNSGQLLKNIPDGITVWMSHGDKVVKIPLGFETIAKTETIPNAVIENKAKKIYGIQFHPEVIHTEFGEQLLKNFLNICGIKVTPKKIDQEFINNIIQDIKDSIGSEKAICALSGGVDSSVAALLVYKAIGKNLIPCYIESGLMRDGETDTLKQVFAKYYNMDIKIINAQKEFLTNKILWIT